MTRLQALDKQLEDLQEKRAKALRTFRLRCKHLHIIEEEYKPCDAGRSDPPYRICADCGAIERGWYCGYHVLTTADDTTAKIPARKIVQTIKAGQRHTIPVMRNHWPIYYVGQSHANFVGGGVKSYESLIAIPPVKKP
jgi:hypothetical protein